MQYTNGELNYNQDTHRQQIIDWIDNFSYYIINSFFIIKYLSVLYLNYFCIL
jgi:hypothetical protein